VTTDPVGAGVHQ
jgi:hypothetical protein